MNLLPLTLKVELLNHLRSFDLVKYQTLHYWVIHPVLWYDLLMFDGLFVSNKNMRFGELGTISLKNLSLNCPVFQNSLSASVWVSLVV
jgi:hypothetical protein